MGNRLWEYKNSVQNDTAFSASCFYGGFYHFIACDAKGELLSHIIENADNAQDIINTLSSDKTQEMDIAGSFAFVPEE